MLYWVFLVTPSIIETTWNHVSVIYLARTQESTRLAHAMEGHFASFQMNVY